MSSCIFKKVEGFDGKINDIIYHPPCNEKATGVVLYFGGDVQDYPENMTFHRDSRQYVEWNLENVSRLLHQRFPSCVILVIRAARMHLRTFACYENFTQSSDFGTPSHEITLDSLRHLNALLMNVMPLLNKNQDNILKNDLPITFVAFSKGCVVLNQLLYSFLALSKLPEEQKLVELCKQIIVMYWLDGGHSGNCDTWVTDKSVLNYFCQLGIKVCIHVTPNQVLCESRPRIGKEEKIFRETLRRLGADIERTLHFENEPKSMENHFKVLQVFKDIECPDT